MKRIIAILLSALFILNLSAAFAEGEPYRYEGSGYVSPEDALIAYVNAMSCGDFTGMLSVFAIESFVANADPSQLHNARSASGLVDASSNIVVNDEYTRHLKLMRRCSEITNVLYTQYVFFTGTEGQQMLETRIVRVRDEEDNAQYMELFAENRFAQIFSGCEVIEPVDPADASEKYSNGVVQETLTTNCFIYGCDEIRSAAIWIRTPEEVYLLTADCGRYGDKWYILELGGTLGTLLRISRNTGGLISYSALLLFEHVE